MIREIDINSSSIVLIFLKKNSIVNLDYIYRLSIPLNNLIWNKLSDSEIPTHCDGPWALHSPLIKIFIYFFYVFDMVHKFRIFFLIRPELKNFFYWSIN